MGLENINAEQHKLIDLVEKWNLSKRFIANQINMPEGTFKNKMSKSQNLYRFSEVEMLKIGTVLDKMLADFQNLLDGWDDEDNDLL